MSALMLLLVALAILGMVEVICASVLASRCDQWMEEIMAHQMMARKMKEEQDAAGSVGPE
jgi:hypothetical protein